MVSRIGQYLTPKVIRPFSTATAEAVMVGVVFAGAVIAGADESVPNLTRQAALAALPFSIAAFVQISIGLSIFRWLQIKTKRISWFYPGILITAVGLLFTRQFVADLIDVEPIAWGTPNNHLTFIFFNASVMILFQQVIGVATQNLERENRRANQALEDLEHQQKLILSGQEQVRRDLAGYLHDNLQSNLLVLGMQMQSSLKNAPEPLQSIGQSFVEEVERIRRVDVRSAITQLTPDLESIPLSASLAELAKKFDKVAKISFLIEPSADNVDLATELKLGAYRVIEQGLQNALKHSKADRVQVWVSGDANALQIQVANPGIVTADLVPGLGLALIQSWCSKLGGKWSLEQAGSDASLKVTLGSAE